MCLTGANLRQFVKSQKGPEEKAEEVERARKEKVEGAAERKIMAAEREQQHVLEMKRFRSGGCENCRHVRPSRPY